MVRELVYEKGGGLYIRFPDARLPMSTQFIPCDEHKVRLRGSCY